MPNVFAPFFAGASLASVDSGLELKEGTTMKTLSTVAVLTLSLCAGSYFALAAQQNQMSFFVTSAGSGKGGDLGGIAGADARCQMLATAAGSTGKTWHAYLST